MTIDRLPSGRSRWSADRRGAASAAREGAGEPSGRDALAGRREGRSGRTGCVAARTSDASGAVCGFEGTGVAADGGRTRTAGAGDDEAGEAGFGSVGRGAGAGAEGVGRGGRGVHGCPAERSRLTSGVRTVRDAPGQWPFRPAVASTRVPSASTERWAPPPRWGRRPTAAVCGTAEGRRCAAGTVRAARAAVAVRGAAAGRELLVPREDFGGGLLGTPPPGAAAAASTTAASAGGSALAEAATAAPPAVAPVARHMSATAASFCRPSRPAARLFSCCRTR
ncbi:hypothetical protein SAMN05421870_107175 [Streptomyces qinglanensis]|uniref:Uncharacterized protein n=1 Tax=Streptomyces qinglanensis TaxID=943816 RepID=A0A1H9U0Y2_9ACTN|nr:hypothetical protein SAMN05421870_107175 [Streptomyces qinglanensis]